ncbi:hypothetical protein K501DRAFT_241856 [Backusella circina FSU 941]|nr:hypothetical protein K501DRAFT_241856 [Backusella circina FSU 941]
MWEPNEQLLLRATVRYKKHEGTLFVTPRRVAWQQQGSSQLNPSISYNDILGLAQTPDTSAKLLLKISTKAPASKDFTFQFISQKALQEREAIKSQVAELFARARGQSSAVSTPAPITPSAVTASPSPSPAQPTPPPLQVNSPPVTPTPPNGGGSTSKSGRQEEFNDRRQLLSTSRDLQTLHKELVVMGKSVDEEEFWSSAYVKRIRQKLKKDAVSREGKSKGKSSRMTRLNPGQQEGADMKYTLTSQIIHNIFTEFPSVKRAYDANVPDKMTEQNFWKRFLASEFFHRSRGGRNQMTAYDDIFDKCLQEEEDENSRPPAMRMDRIKYDINLAATEEDHLDGGNAPDFTMRAGRDAKVLPLIRRFNRHSMRVLEIPPTKTKSASKPLFKPDNLDSVEKAILINDLVNEPPSEKIILDIRDTRRYFESQSGGQNNIKLSEEDTKNLLNGFKATFQAWQPNMAKQVVNARAADRVCDELTTIIKKKMRYSDKAATDVKLPPQIQQRVQIYHSTTNEILRHFWASFEPYKAEKNHRMVDGLRKQQIKLNELLKTVESVDGDVERCKKTLMPVMSAVDRAFEAAKKRGKRKPVQ